MERAWILGRPAALDAAVAEAGKLIAASTSMLIAGLGTDVAGAAKRAGQEQRVGAHMALGRGRHHDARRAHDIEVPQHAFRVHMIHDRSCPPRQRNCGARTGNVGA